MNVRPTSEYKGDDRLVTAVEAARLLGIGQSGFLLLLNEGKYQGTVYEAKSEAVRRSRRKCPECDGCGEVLVEKKVTNRHEYYDPRQVMAMELPREWQIKMREGRDPFANQRVLPMDGTRIV